MSVPNKFEDLIARSLLALAIVGSTDKPELSVVTPGTSASITARPDFMGVMALLPGFKSQVKLAVELDRQTTSALTGSFVALVEQVVSRVEETYQNGQPKRRDQLI